MWLDSYKQNTPNKKMNISSVDFQWKSPKYKNTIEKNLTEKLIYNSWESLFNPDTFSKSQKSLNDDFYKIIWKNYSEIKKWNIDIKIVSKVDKDPINSKSLKDKISKEFEIVNKIAQIILSKSNYQQLQKSTILNQQNFDSEYNSKLCFIRAIEMVLSSFPNWWDIISSPYFSIVDNKNNYIPFKNYKDIYESLQKKELELFKNNIINKVKPTSWNARNTIPYINFKFEWLQQPKLNNDKKEDRRISSREITWHSLTWYRDKK